MIVPHSLEQFWFRTKEKGLANFAHRSRDFWLFELSVWLHVCAITVISVFIPILLLERGFDLQTVLLFYAVFHWINFFANFAAGALVSSIGARTTIIIAIAFQLGFLVLYGMIEPGIMWVLLLMAACAALYDALYYTSSMYLFMRSTNDLNNSGKNTGIFYAVVRSAGIIGPVIGSIGLIVFNSQTMIISLSFLFFVLSVIPLFYISLERGTRATMMPLRKFLSRPHVLANHLSLALFKIHESVGAVLWPVFIFLYFGTLESVAALAILIPIVALVCSLLIGQVDMRKRYSVIAWGAGLTALIWLGRIMFESTVWYYGSIVIAGLLLILMLIPIDANLFRAGKETNELTASVMKNAVSMGTKAALYTILLLAGLGYSFGFVLAGVCMIMLTALNLMLQRRRHFTA